MYTRADFAAARIFVSKRRRPAHQKRRTTALGTKGARLLRLIKRSAPPSKANFDKYRRIRPKKLFRNAAVPTRGHAEPP